MKYASTLRLFLLLLVLATLAGMARGDGLSLLAKSSQEAPKFRITLCPAARTASLWTTDGEPICGPTPVTVLEPDFVVFSCLVRGVEITVFLRDSLGSLTWTVVDGRRSRSGVICRG
jgi:hypothetical protein